MIKNVLKVTGLVAALFSAAQTLSPPSARAQEALKIGDLSSYNRWSAFTVPYRNGWQLAVEQINANGGVLGKKLVVISRDDGGTPTDAIRVAEELVTREGVSVLMGTFLSNISLAVADFAKQKKVVFVPANSATDALSLDKGNKYTFHFRANVYTYTNMLAEQGSKLGLKRWAIVAPNYEYGQSAASAFKRLLKQRQPDAEIVAEQYPPLGKVDGGAIANALEEAKPDGIFNALFGADLGQFARDGLARGLFDKRTVLSLASGYPEYLIPMKDQVPVGWITHGYPAAEIADPAHKAFIGAYQKKYNELPGAFAMQGYVEMMLIKDAISKANTVNPDELAAAMKGMKFDSIVGPLQIRAIDNKVTMGTWIGKLAVKDGVGAFVDWSYKDGANYMIPEAEVKAARKE
ncbi:ABC transporter substrate-binding protein [Tardiphaga sp. 866_E4_N2_1]|uniref:ABC transporter substrate-binding protein n=1 Tax=unclassified Tardiphaga TaxID=2631404 RepID=UPI003F291157